MIDITKPQPGLGRVHVPDPNDNRYLLRSLNPKAATAAANIPYRYHTLARSRFRDQGTTSACTGAAARHWLDAGPVQNLGGPDWWDLYKLNQKSDSWPGEEPAYYGSSVRASFKVMQKLGFVKSYGWAFDLETAINHILTESGMVFGTSWFTGCMKTDKQGFIHADGNVEGGHAWYARGANREKVCPDGSKGAVRGVQSWGDWGDNGQFWISFKDLDAMIKDYGEACTAFEIKAPVA